ncbi:MAG TPA: hypothetical protein VIT45_08780 [Allosphingosinicella sp.]
MYGEPLSVGVKRRLGVASQQLRTANPTSFMQRMLDETFSLPAGHPAYAMNALTPGSAPLEPTFRGAQPGALSFNLEPLGPEASGADRRDSATREMRRMVSESFGGSALRWFDQASEPYRGMAASQNLNYGAFFGSAFDREGLQSANVTFESGGDRMGDLPPHLLGLIGPVMARFPGMQPVFTTLLAGRQFGSQRMTFLMTTALRVGDLQPIMAELGLGAQHPGILQLIGVALGGRFELPAGSTLIALGRGPQGAELELHIMLDAIPDVPPDFLALLTLGLTERPRELTALERFMSAFTPETDVWPGRFSILGVRAVPGSPVKVSLFLRPVEFEIPPAAMIAQAGNGLIHA